MNFYWVEVLMVKLYLSVEILGKSTLQVLEDDSFANSNFNNYFIYNNPEKLETYGTQDEEK